MAQRKETKKTIKVRDLKPKKDAKGGVCPAPQAPSLTQTPEPSNTKDCNTGQGSSVCDTQRRPTQIEEKWHREKKPKKIKVGLKPKKEPGRHRGFDPDRRTAVS